MKSIIGASIMALLLVCLAVPGLVLAGAEAEGSTAEGSFKFALEDGEIRFVEFKATAQGEGQAIGEMTFSDPVAVPVPDPDDPEKQGSPGVLVRAKFDCMDTVKNTAVIGGEIFASNVPDAKLASQYCWWLRTTASKEQRTEFPGVSTSSHQRDWIRTDAELEDDKGASLTWWATDFERKDDVGIPMPPNKLVTCKSFPAATA